MQVLTLDFLVAVPPTCLHVSSQVLPHPLVIVTSFVTKQATAVMTLKMQDASVSDCRILVEYYTCP